MMNKPCRMKLGWALGMTIMLACGPVHAQQGELVPATPAAEAGKLIGTNAVVVGKVAEVFKTAKVIRINFEEKYPKHVFSAIVFTRNFNVFTNLETLVGKTVEVSGKVALFNRKPEIILNSRGQMRVLEEAKPAVPSDPKK